MTGIIAKAGENVTDENGYVICKVKKDLVMGAPCSAYDFHEFSPAEIPWVPGLLMDTRCFRANPKRSGTQVCINGEWRPE